MARSIERLSARAAQTASRPGLHTRTVTIMPRTGDAGRQASRPRSENAAAAARTRTHAASPATAVSAAAHAAVRPHVRLPVTGTPH